MTLDQTAYDRAGYDDYIVGSAEVVGLMCLSVFVKGDKEQYQALLPHARSLGAAFQKINFLRDLRADWAGLGRTYFPGLDLDGFDHDAKQTIEAEIEADFAACPRRHPEVAQDSQDWACTWPTSTTPGCSENPAHAALADPRGPHPHPQQAKSVLLMGSYVRHQFNLL